MEHVLDRFRWWGNRPLLLLACFFLFLALVLAAIDQIPTMVDAGLLALFFLAVHGVVVVYLRLPAEDRSVAFSRRFLRRTAFFAFTAALVLASLYWFAGWVPLKHIPSFVLAHFAKLDFIPSAFALVLPYEWRSGFHRYFDSTTYCFPGPFWWESMRYLRTAVPAYTLVFFLGACGVRLAVAALRGRSSDTVPRR